MINKDYKIWRVYYKDEQFDTYGMRKNINTTYFNTSDINVKGDNINHLCLYLSELCAMYYVWKNNLKSTYISMVHYRRNIKKIDEDDFKKFDNHGIKYNGVGNVNNYHIMDSAIYKIYEDDFKNYFRIIHKLNEEQINELFNRNHNYTFITSFLFACKWETFCEICECIFGFFDFVMGKDKWKNLDVLMQYKNEKIKLYEKYKQLGIINDIYEQEPLIYDRRPLCQMMENMICIFLTFKNINYYPPEYNFHHESSVCIIDTSNNINKDLLIKTISHNIYNCDFLKFYILYDSNIIKDPYKHFGTYDELNTLFAKDIIYIKSIKEIPKQDMLYIYYINNGRYYYVYNYPNELYDENKIIIKTI